MIREVILGAASASLGAVFLVSAIPKLRHPRGFAMTVAAYQLLPPVFCILLVLTGLLGPVATGIAASDIANLGTPTNDLPSHLPGAFRRIATNLRQQGKPELLFIGTMADGGSAAERWPVVKALEQFGTLTHLSPAISRTCSYPHPSKPSCLPARMAGQQMGVPTFDWSHASYRSPYLVFVHRDLIDEQLRVRDPLSSIERSLFDRYIRPEGVASWTEAVWQTAATQFPPDPSRQFPLIVIGNQLETGDSVAIYGEMSVPAHGSVVNLPFDSVQASLSHGRPQGGAPRSLVTDYNAETNLITAMICHADGLRPSRICTRSAIRAILRHVR